MSQQLPPLPEMLPLSIDTNPSPPVSPLSPLSPVSSIHNNISSPSSSPVVDPNLRVQPVTNPVITPSSQLSNGHPGSNVTTSNLPNGNANPQPNLQQAHPVQAYGIHSPSLQQSSGAISSIIQNGTTGAQDPKVVRATSWWWWWEIGSSLLSMTSMCLILAILFAVNEKPLRHWKLAIQPNSLISVFTTVGKTAMMVSVTSCVSQLKWRHFQRRPQKLSHLQLFDDASRGPWGALLLLFGVRSRAFLAWIFAIITIIALAIEPSAQQILDFPTRVSLLSNVTADIGRADSYYSRAFVEGQPYKTVANPDLFNLQASIINGARGQVFQPPFNCPEPATECRWKDIRTLGICRDIKDVSNTTTYKCSGSTTLLLNCTYSIPDRIDEDTEPIIVSYSQDANVQNIPKTTLFRSLPGSGQEVGSLATVRVTNPERGLPKVETTPPATEIFYTTFYWCEKVFHNITASSGNLHINEDPTGKRLNVAGGITDIVTIDGHKNLDNKMNAAYFSLPSNETNIIYNISRSTVSFIFNYMTILFDTTALQTSENRGAPDRSIIDLAQYFLFHNISDITQNVSDSLTNQLRGGRTQTLQDLGDNANATTSSGEAYWNETYVKVRWAWLIIPLLETVLVSILLVVTIVVTWNEVLFKTSVAALFVHGLDGWREDEVEVGEPETAEKLEKRMEGMVAGFERDGGGVLKFVRA